MTALLPWHRAHWERMTAAHARGRLPHALLLFGPGGMGKAAFAELLARGLLCERPGGDHLPCGACGACVLLEAGTHPDIWRCMPEDEGADRARATIGIDAIRDLTEFMSLRTHRGGWKVALIDHADRMNQNSANALLKTLEEPPENALLLLCTERPARLPATVLSRCQRIRFAPADAEGAVVRDWLAVQLDPGADPAALLRLAGGAPLAALGIARSGGPERRAELLDAFEALALRRADPLRTAEAWLRFGVRESLYWVYLWLAEMVRLTIPGAAGDPGDERERARLERLAAHVSTGSLLAMQDRIVAALRASDGQVNHQLLLEDVLIGIAGLADARA